MGTLEDLSGEVIAAYNAPFPSEKYKAGARIFPMLVPVEMDDPEAFNNRKAWNELIKWEKPFLTLWGDGDPIMKGADKVFQITNLMPISTPATSSRKKKEWRSHSALSRF